MTIVRDAFYIDGAWVGASSREVFTVTSSGTGEPYATVPVGTIEEAALAVEAAAKAFASWSTTPPQARAAFRPAIVCHDGAAGSSAAWLARLVWDQEVAGSNPAFPTRSCPRQESNPQPDG